MAVSSAEDEFNPDTEYGYNANVDDVKRQIGYQISQALLAEPGLPRQGLSPDWRNQKYRIVVPCKSNEEHAWYRTGLTVSLGEMFLHLGMNWTARQIYYLFRSMRIVGLKRRKGVSATAPGSASVTGTTASSFQGAAIRSSLRPAKESIVQDYCHSQGLDSRLGDKDEFFNSAVRLIY